MPGDNFTDMAAATPWVLCRTAGSAASVRRAIYGPSLPYLLDSLVLQHWGKKERRHWAWGVFVCFVLTKELNSNRRRSKIGLGPGAWGLGPGAWGSSVDMATFYGQNCRGIGV
jgi:hypothetical protein